jgi:hypothetical protein
MANVAHYHLGKGSARQYIHNTGYLFKQGDTHQGDTHWTSISYTSTEPLISNACYPKTANTTIAMTSTELAIPKLCARLCLHLAQMRMEIRIPGQCVYTIVLADIELAAVGEQKRAQGTETNISPSGYASMPDAAAVSA